MTIGKGKYFEDIGKMLNYSNIIQTKQLSPALNNFIKAFDFGKVPSILNLKNETYAKNKIFF